MKRLRWVALIVGVLLLVGAASWGLLVHLGPWLATVTQGPPAPERPPELFGMVEKLSTSTKGKKQYLIRCKQPPPEVAESGQKSTSVNTARSSGYGSRTKRRSGSATADRANLPLGKR